MVIGAGGTSSGTGIEDTTADATPVADPSRVGAIVVDQYHPLFLQPSDTPVWDKVWRLSDEDKFQSLKLLLFSEIYFRHWEASSDSFPNLKRLVLKKCKYVEDIPIDFAEICSLESIELHNCSTLAEDSARKIEQEQEDMGNNSLKVYIL